MKNTFLISAILLSLSLIAQGQIIITSADMPTIGIVVYQATDTTPIVNAGSAGANQTWVFDSASMKIQTLDTISFVAPSSTPYAANFPSANIAWKIPGQNLAFYAVDSSSVSLVGGVETSNPVPLPFHPSQTYMLLPSTYNTSFNSFSIADTSTPYVYQSIDSARLKSIFTDSSIVDAWGSVTTPLGTFNCIRQKITELEIDSTWGYVSGLGWVLSPGGATTESYIEYRWWVKGVKFPVVDIKQHPSGSVKYVEWLTATPGLGIQNIAANQEIRLYPNPASEMLNIHYNTNADNAKRLILYNALGQEAGSYLIPNSSEHTIRIPVADLLEGMYFYCISAENNEIFARGKFCIAR